MTASAAPRAGEHPVWWALTSVVGLTPGAVRRRAVVSRSVQIAATTGRPVELASLRRLVALLRRGADEMLRDAPPLRDSPPLVQAHRRATFALLDALAAEALAPAPPPPPRSTTLVQDLLLALGPAGRPRALVISDLRAHHRPQSLRRAARRVGVAERLGPDGAPWWIPPPRRPQDPPPVFGPPARVYAQPTGPRQRAAHDAMSVYLGRRPDLSADSRDVVAALRQRGHSRSQIFRAARDMNLVRETTGFGPQKRSVWRLPHAPPPSPPSTPPSPRPDYARHTSPTSADEV